ncbi:MAG: beta-ketoacyl-ACP synthase II [Chloroflexi bacterium]|nr:beta-ketoacyl-ACP synthase II [Chloroflexota bacterium]
MPQTRVVITGVGAVTPVGNDVPTTWRNVVEGKSGVGPITLFDASDLETQIAAEVKDFDPVALFGAKAARTMDRYSQFALAAARQAVADAGLTFAGDNERVAVIVGTGIGGMATLAQQLHALDERGPRRVSPFFIPMVLADTAAGNIAIEYGIRGPNLAVISACASGANCIGEAAMMIRHGRVDKAICGAAEAGILRLAIAAFNVMGAVSRRNDEPTRACRPFDVHRDGFVMGEGAGILVLEKLEDAQARGAHIYAEILGYGLSADAYHITAPLENGAGAALAMAGALRDAGLAPTDVEYINAHGTSTPLNDRAETIAIKSVFGDHAYRLAVSSTKSVMGHLLGASGAVEAIITAKALEEGIIPPTINYETSDPECDLDYTPNRARPTPIRVALSNSFGFGGHNASLALGRYP